MKSEKLQFALLCEQSTANVWRKVAYRRLKAIYDPTATVRAPDIFQASVSPELLHACAVEKKWSFGIAMLAYPPW